MHFITNEDRINKQANLRKEITMADELDEREPMTTDTHKPARPLKYFKDKEGYGWLCDKDINPDKGLRAQGCWRCDEMAFPTGGR
jgi:hypothetical protein